MLRRIRTYALVALASLVAATAGAAEPARLVRLADEIRAEATRITADPEGHPLPLAGHWNKRGGTGCSPQYQLGLLEAGHHIFPWFEHPRPERDLDDERHRTYYEEPMARMKALRLPITLVTTQWESLLYRMDKYRDLPREKTPLLVTPEKIVKKVSPAGPTLTVDVPGAGAFYLVTETDGKAERVAAEKEHG